MWWVIINTVVVAAVIYVGMSIKSRRAVRDALGLASSEGSGPAVSALPCKLRLLHASGWRGRWREVVIRREAGGSLVARPYRPRPGAPLDLSGTRATGTRKALPTEKWWFRGPIVLIARDEELGDVEFGFGADDVLCAAAEVFGLAAIDS